jgi:hypothetical protein
MHVRGLTMIGLALTATKANTLAVACVTNLISLLI